VADEGIKESLHLLNKLFALGGKLFNRGAQTMADLHLSST
jgi:hypothetical protein